MGIHPETDLKTIFTGDTLSRLSDAIDARAAAGDPRSRFLLAKNFEQAIAAAKDFMPDTVFIEPETEGRARCGRDSCGVKAFGVRVLGDDIRVEVYAPSYYNKDSITNTSAEVVLSKAAARELALAILKMTEE